MRARLALLLTVVSLAAPTFAKEVWIAASGAANGIFFSDARIFNPNDKDITIQATFLPRSDGSVSNAGEQPISFTVPKRQMKVSDDIVTTLLLKTGQQVGGIRFVSADDFVVTQRVYAISTTACAPGGTNPCTLGQFVNGVNVTDALLKGVVLQLKRNPAFRTNIGGTNTTTTTAHVTFRLYDKDNAIVATKTMDVAPYGNFGPSEFAGFFGGSSADLSDAWVSFVSDQPLIVYGSVVDNSSGDQTYIPAAADSGTTTQPPEEQVKNITIHAVDFFFDVTAPSGLKAGDKVKFEISAQGLHGFALADPSGALLINMGSIGPTPTERTVTLTSTGRYTFFCTNTSCGIGHTDMFGEIVVGTAGPGGPGNGY